MGFPVDELVKSGKLSESPDCIQYGACFESCPKDVLALSVVFEHCRAEIDDDYEYLTFYKIKGGDEPGNLMIFDVSSSICDKLTNLQNNGALNSVTLNDFPHKKVLMKIVSPRLN